MNKKKASAIENQILKLVKIAGPEALLNGFEEETYDYVSDEYIEFEYNNEYENSNNDIESISGDTGNVNIDALEVVNITNIKHVNKNEKLVYERKIIYFNSNIACEGDIEFVDCVVVYNDNSYGGIRLSTSSSLNAINTSFVCKNKNDKAFILSDAYSIGDILFEKCVFYDCSNFLNLKDVNSFRICDSVMYNISNGFISVSTDRKDICLNNVRIMQNDLKDYNIPSNDVNVFKLISYRANTVISNVYVFESNNFRNKIVEKRKIESKYFDEHSAIACLNYFQFEYAYEKEIQSVITNSKFVNAKNIFINATKIENCIFENCRKVSETRYMSEDTEIDINNNIFRNCSSCYYNILDIANAKISYCRFIDCIGRICEGHFEKVIFTYCEFIGCKNIDNDRDYDPEIMIKLKEKNSIIKDCIFECVDAKYGFIIGSSANDDRDGIKVMIEDCEFINCASQRESKKLIKQWEHYYGMFNKRKETKVVDVINSQGWGNVATKVGMYDADKYNDGKASHAGCLAELYNFNGILSQNYEEELKGRQVTNSTNKEQKHIELTDVKIDSSLRVIECFTILGRGLVARGKVEGGSFKVGDIVSWELDGVTKNAKLTGIEKFRELLNEAHDGEHIGMLLDGVSMDEIRRDCIIYLNK